MDAGVPIKAPVAGISIGLIFETDNEYKILTDIQGIEDFAGDMDFKVTATKQGITAIQLDTKLKGLDFKIIKEALERARQANNVILEKMTKVIAAPRAE